MNIDIEFYDTVNNTGVAPGTIVEHDGDLYRFVHLQTSSGAISVGSVLYWLPAIGEGEVTDDVANSKLNFAYAVSSLALATTLGGYFWAYYRKNGITMTTNGDDDIAQGDSIIGATAGIVNSVTAGTACTYKCIGFAQADDDNAANTVLVNVDLTGS